MSRGVGSMAQSSQFSAAKVLEAAQQAEVGGNRDYAVQFYRHITEHHPQSPEAVSAQDGLARLLGPQLNSVGEQSGPVSATVSEQNDFMQPPNGRGTTNQTGAGAAPASHKRTQPQPQPPATQTQSSVATGAAMSAQSNTLQSNTLQPHTLQSQSAQIQSMQSNGSDAAAPRPQVQNAEAAAATSVSPGQASNGANRPGNASTMNGAGNGAGNGTGNGTGNGASASPLSGNGGAANGAPAAAAGANIGANVAANNGAVQFNGAAATSNGGARPQSVQNPALSYQPGPAPAHPEPEVQSHGQPAQFSLAQGNLAQGNPGQSNLAVIAVPPGKDHYRIGRAVTYIFGFLGWLLLLASIGAAGAAIFAPGIIPGLAPRGGGLAGILPTLLSGAIAIFGSLVIISFAQLLRAVFDNANANRELVALRRAAAHQQA